MIRRFLDHAHQVTSFARRIVHWLFHDPWRVWGTLAGVGFPLLFFSVLFDDWERRLRWTGMILELLGLLTVVLGMSEARKLFGRPSLLDIIKSWFVRKPAYKLQHRMASGVAMAGASATVRAYASTTFTAPPEMQLGERVKRLEDRMNEVTGLISGHSKRLDDEEIARQAAIEAERAARDEADARVRKTIEEFAVGGLYLQMTGVVWLALGIVLATTSPDLHRWITGTSA